MSSTKAPLTGWILVSLGGIFFASGFGAMLGLGAALIALGVWTGIAGAARLMD